MTDIHFKIFLFIILSLGLHAQSKEKLESERKRLIKEIEKTSKFLEKTTLSKKTTLHDLKAIETQVESRDKLINTIQTDITKSDATIQENIEMLDSLQIQMTKLTGQYGGLLRYNYLQQLSNNKWSYILSASNLNTMLIRWRYLRQFEEYAKVKKNEIISLNQNINASNKVITQTIEERKSLLEEKEVEKQKLEDEINQKNKALKEISSKESVLKKELAKKGEERERLNSAIESIIYSELRKAKERNASIPARNTESEKLSSNFSNNKGKLPWPIASGFVSLKYGKQPHQTQKSLTIKNNGIDITTKGEQSVKAVFGGEVVGITKISGSKHMVVIQHGAYYTIYINIEDVTVRSGDSVSASQTIGRAVPDEDGNTEIHFEIYKDRSTLNPESWLK